MGKPMRLDKFLTEMKQGSRSQVKELIRKGRVTVDGAVCRDSDRKIDPETSEIRLDGAFVGWAKVEYYLLNKPQGVVSATEDPKYKTVVDLIETSRRKDLFPVGRLDIDTEGLLLITNDGALAHELLSPKKHVDKVYFARVRGTLVSDAKERMAAGMELTDGTKVRPAQLEILNHWAEEAAAEQTDVYETRLTIHEGKFHQVKRMFEACGGEVIYLKRLSMGPLTLPESLNTGEYRPLTEAEVAALKTVHAKADAEKADVQKTEAEPEECRKKAALNGKKAVLFDLDGTLVDSMWMWKSIDIEYLARFGYDCPEDLQKSIEGMSFSETAVYFKERFSIPDTLEQMKADWTQMSIDKYRYEVPLKPGAGEFLKELKRRGIKTGIATSNGREMVDAVLKALQIEEYFDVVTTACEVAAGKPAPDIYLKVAETLGAAPEDCLVFEDVPAGILAGKRAGMEVCAVEDDFSLSMTEEKKKLADYYIKDYDELLLLTTGGRT